MNDIFLASVVIPCFNAQRWIRETLRSVVVQDVQSVEIIVVDDGSTDDSAQIIESDFPSVHLIKTTNQGPSRARNVGTQASSGEFIQYLDADDLLAPGKLKRQLQTLQQSQADVAYGDWQRLRMQPDGRFAEAEIVSRRLEDDPEIAMFTDFWCPPAAYLFRREIVDQVGGWNEGLPVIQDARFALDCALHGAKFVYCPGVMARYRIHTAESVSRMDPIAFTRDCFKNAAEVEAWWRQHGGLTTKRRTALLDVYGQVARASFQEDPATFQAAYQALERLCPGYAPSQPRHLAFVSRLVGYPRAEALAGHYRRGKALLKALAGG